MRFINDDYKIKHGGRKAVRITEDELRKEIIECAKKVNEDEYEEAELEELDIAVSIALKYDPQLKRDQKYDVGHENVLIDDYDGMHVGLHTIGDLSFCGVITGGDWENEVFVVLYWDGKRVRLYTPTYGNNVNMIEKCGIGSECQNDNNQYKDKYVQLGAWNDSKYFAGPNYPAIYGLDEPELEWDAIKQDFTSRIDVV